MTAPRSCWWASIRSIHLVLIWIAILVGVLADLWPHWQVIVLANQNRPAKSSGSSAAQASPDGYTGSAACAHCHEEIYASFTHTRMGRSLTAATPAVVKNLPASSTVDSERLDRHFDVIEKNGKLLESEYQTAADGKEVFRNTREVDWIIGAGANGFGGLTQRGAYLFEAPVSFYSKTQKWELSPGYEVDDIGFNRPVLAGCISCHSGRPKPLDQTTGKFAAVPFSQVAIGCENCHGPGAAHIRAKRAPGGTHSGSQIVNPSRLSADLENNICMSCHEAGDSRVPRPGKTYQDFRPGTPLDDTLSILMVPRKRGDANDSDHVQHYYEMSMSKCFRSTAGQLRCGTCHDPHIEPTAEEAPPYFNQKCMDCHANRPCRLPVAERRQTTPSDNCIGCHMPRRNAPETAHTSLTNHRITARAGEPWPDEAFQQTTAALPDLVHVNRVAGRNEDLPQSTLLEAYFEISMRNPEYVAPYRKLLDEMELRNPEDAAVQLALGRKDLQDGDENRAIQHLDRVIELDPESAAGYSYLSQALEKMGRNAEAIAASEKAVNLDPYVPLWQKALIEQLIAGQQYDKAQAAMVRYLKNFPEDGQMRQVLAIAQQ